MAALDVDPFSDAFLTDPYPRHALLRDAGPAVALAGHDIWVSARHAPVRAALLDPEGFCSAAGVGMSDFRREPPWRPPSLLLEADPPEHTRARRVVAGVLSAAAMRRLEDDFRGAADAAVARLATGAPFDAMAELAIAYPLTVFSDAVGLPTDGRENLLTYARIAFDLFGPRNARFAAALERMGSVREWIAEHCEPDRLAPDGMGAQIHARASAEGYTRDEAATLVRSFLTAGVDTTVHGLGNALWCLATHPEQFALLRDDPELARAAFEEVLRFEAPVQTFFRTTTRPVDLDGVAIPAEAKVLLMYGAANRDPRYWSNPDTFDVTRTTTGLLAFGFGIHACVGMAMARLEGEALLTALARHTTLELAGEPERMLNNTLRGFTRLPLRLA